MSVQAAPRTDACAVEETCLCCLFLSDCWTRRLRRRSALTHGDGDGDGETGEGGWSRCLEAGEAVGGEAVGCAETGDAGGEGNEDERCDGDFSWTSSGGADVMASFGGRPGWYWRAGVGDSCGDSPPLRTDAGDEEGGAIAIDASEGMGGIAAATAAMPAIVVAKPVAGGASGSSPSPSSSSISSSVVSDSSTPAPRPSLDGAGDASLPFFILTHLGTTGRSGGGPGESEDERGAVPSVGLSARRREGDDLAAAPTTKAGEPERLEGEVGESGRCRRFAGEGESEEERDVDKARDATRVPRRAFRGAVSLSSSSSVTVSDSSSLVAGITLPGPGDFFKTTGATSVVVRLTTAVPPWLFE